MEQQKEIALPSEVPPGIPDQFEEQVKILFDLHILAYQADLTRIITFMFGRETSQRTYANIGVPEAHHGVSHHDEKPELLEKLAKIDHYHVQLLTDGIGDSSAGRCEGKVAHEEVVRIDEGDIVIDPLTVLPGQDADLTSALKALA